MSLHYSFLSSFSALWPFNVVINMRKLWLEYICMLHTYSGQHPRIASINTRRYVGNRFRAGGRSLKLCLTGLGDWLQTSGLQVWSSVPVICTLKSTLTPTLSLSTPPHCVAACSWVQQIAPDWREVLERKHWHVHRTATCAEKFWPPWFGTHSQRTDSVNHCVE